MLSPREYGSSRVVETKGSPSVLRDDAVDDSVVLRLLGTHEVVALCVLAHRVQILPRVVRNDLIKTSADVDDLFSVDLDIRRLSLKSRRDLVDEDLRVGQRHPLARRTASQQ